MNNKITYNKNRLFSWFGQFCESIFIVQKLNNWVGYLLFFAISLFFGYTMAFKWEMGMMLLALLCGTAVLLVCLFNTEAGFYINMTYSFFAFFFSRWLIYYGIDLPVGVLSDVFILATFFSLFIKRGNLKQTFNEFTSTIVVRFLLIVYAYFALQLFNPNAHSFFGWYTAFRKILATLLLFFTAFHLFNSYAAIAKFLKYIFVLSLMAGAYGCIQQWFGVTEFEWQWIVNDPHGFGLAFIGGELRKFSTMSDPAAFSVSMAAGAALFIVLLTEQENRLKKNILLIGVIFMILGMSYSGTRTANAMLVAGLAFFAIFTFDRKSTRVFAICGTLIFLIVLYGPFNNKTINRFRSTFSAEEDASFQVREKARKAIQAYIHSHPIGGGLATTGATGKVYNPGHPLAGFQPDSGYLKKATEIGPIGFGLYCILYFLILQTGIRGYFSSTDKKVKVIYAACTCSIYCFYVGEYAQKAIGQISDMVLYYPMIVILLKLKKFKPDHNLST
jgi:putative inorganic carbon (HCO3(-)) transporter